METQNRARRILGITALVVWSTVAPSLYPLPSQRTAEIRALAREAVASQTYLESQGYDIKGIAEIGTEQQWTAGIERSFWTMWIETLVVLVLGLIAAVATAYGSRWWIFLFLLSAAAVMYRTFVPMISSMSQAGGLEPWLRVWWRVLGQRVKNGETQATVFLDVYWFFVWPLLHIALTAVAIFIYARIRQSAPSRSTTIA